MNRRDREYRRMMRFEPLLDLVGLIMLGLARPFSSAHRRPRYMLRRLLLFSLTAPEANLDGSHRKPRLQWSVRAD